MRKEMKMPAYFVGHGSPMNVILDNAFTRSLARIPEGLPHKPQAILVVSAHWLTRGSYVSVTVKPETIYDFGGFPAKLYQIKYPADGAPKLAQELVDAVPTLQADAKWGLDHGAWAILKHIFPQADIPVFQLSIDYKQSMEYHFALAKSLQYLRERGVMIVGSGNIVHNIGMFFAKGDEQPYDWAVDFDEWAKEKILQRDYKSLLNYESQGRAAHLSVPTVDHYVPLLYTLALVEDEDNISFTHEEVIASMSMRCIRVG